MIILGLHPSSSFTLKRSDSSHGHTKKKRKKNLAADGIGS